MGWGWGRSSQGGSKKSKPIPSLSHGAGLKSYPIPAPPTLQGEENLQEAKRGGTGQARQGILVSNPNRQRKLLNNIVSGELVMYLNLIEKY